MFVEPLADLWLDVARAEADGGPVPDADARLGELRELYRTLAEPERGALGRAAATLRDRIDGLAPGHPDARGGDPRPLPETLARLGVEALRPGQDRAIGASLCGHDALVVMPTGSGKSLCYQAPALAMGGLSIVVSPLVALIADQHDRLHAAGHPVRRLDSGRTAQENRATIDAIAAGQVRLVFCAPERFHSAAFLNAVQRNRVDLFAVDEAHCLSEWGHDFRPEYLRLAEWRDAVRARCTVALTATATPETARDIAGRLALRDPVVVSTGFDRPNVRFDVIRLAGAGSVARKWAHLMAGLREEGGRPAIVYCGTRRETEEVSTRLREQGIDAVGYHAGMAPDVRSTAMDAFMSRSADVIVATNAFGMGVDRADVRAVWHWSLPTSLEAYYQEAGRAGRDGLPARAALLAMNADLGRLITFNQRDQIDVGDVERAIASAAHVADEEGAFTLPRGALGDGGAVALAIADRIGALRLEAGHGGAISGTIRTARLDDEQAHMVELAARRSRERGWSAYRAVRAYVDGDACRREVLVGHFGDARAERPAAGCCDRCDPLPEIDLQLPRTAAGRGPASRGGAGEEGPALDGDGERRFEQLREWRRGRADGKPAYTVCNDRALRAIAAAPPDGVEGLLDVHGIGPTFVERHGADLIAVLAVAERP